MTAPELHTLFDALARGDEPAALGLLLRAPGLARAADERGCTALHRAAEHDRVLAARQLLAAGADLEARDAVHGSTPLAWAAYYGSAAVATRLLAAGADHRRVNTYGLTPLEIAEGGARGEHPEAAHRSQQDFAALVAALRAAQASEQEPAMQTQSFDPATSTRELSISGTDFLQLLFLPAFARILQEQAPDIDLRVRVATAAGYGAMLESGELDLMLGSILMQDHPGLKRRQLGREPFACAVRAGHPRISDRLTLEEYLAETHILVSPTQSNTPGIVDARLEARGFKRRVAVRLATFLIAPMVVQGSDHILTAPRLVIESFREALKLQVFSPPIELETLPVWMVWHERTHDDPAQRWLRDRVAQAYQEQQTAVGLPLAADTDEPGR